VKTSAGWQAKGNLVLPKSVIEKGRDDKETLLARFQESLDDFLTRHENMREPYFLFYKAKFDGRDGSICRQAFTIYKDRKPPFVQNSCVYFVDNSRGLYVMLWMVDERAKVIFNTEGVQQLKGILRSSATG